MSTLTNMKFLSRDTLCYEPNKIYILGDLKVGKTSLIKRLQGQTLQEETDKSNNENIFGIFSYKHKMEDFIITLKEISDTPNWKFTKILADELEEVKAVIIVFSLIDESTFNFSKLLIDFIIKNNSNKFMNLILIGSKLDLINLNDDYENIFKNYRSKIYDFVDKIPNLFYFEISCKNEYDHTIQKVWEAFYNIEFEVNQEEKSKKDEKNKIVKKNKEDVSCVIL